MPLLQITTNQPGGNDEERLDRLSREVADLLGKPEQYVMINLAHNPSMRFAGSGEPLAYAELKSLGLPEQDSPRLSERLCSLISDLFDVPVARIYIEFSSPPRHLWGWNATTF